MSGKTSGKGDLRHNLFLFLKENLDSKASYTMLASIIGTESSSILVHNRK
jgi:hypothetical protein